MLDETHAPDLRSWVESANDPASDFPIQNLPFGVFRRVGTNETPRVGVAIGEQIVDVAACARAGIFHGEALSASHACSEPTLNTLMSLGRGATTALRRALSDLLRADRREATTSSAQRSTPSVPMGDAELFVPARIGDYSDFYASIHHATNVGKMFRPDNPLLPNYKWVPIGYHGRASSIVASGTPIGRPSGQTRDGSDGSPVFGPTKRLDYEMEIGAFIGRGNALGTPIAIDDAEQHVFGLCLVNDWSARDIQTWEYQPLGPFLAKSFATSVSPWVVTLDALAPFRIPAFPRAEYEPSPLQYINSLNDTKLGGFNITVEVWIETPRMRAMGLPRFRVSSGNFADMYWTVSQLVTHHASNGCNLRPGDLLASGTISGPAEESRGCLLERTWRGTIPLRLPSGETRTFLEDGDRVIMTACCDLRGYVRIGFGECEGTVVGQGR